MRRHFSLKQLFLFVLFAAVISAGFAYWRNHTLPLHWRTFTRNEMEKSLGNNIPVLILVSGDSIQTVSMVRAIVADSNEVRAVARAHDLTPMCIDMSSPSQDGQEFLQSHQIVGVGLFLLVTGDARKPQISYIDGVASTPIEVAQKISSLLNK